MSISLRGVRLWQYAPLGVAPRIQEEYGEYDVLGLTPQDGGSRARCGGPHDVRRRGKSDELGGGCRRRRRRRREHKSLFP